MKLSLAMMRLGQVTARWNPSGSIYTWGTLGWIPFSLLAQRQPVDVGMRPVAGDWHVVAARGSGCAVRTARAVTVSKRFLSPRKSVPTKVREKVRRRSVLTRLEDIGVSANVSDASDTVVAARRFSSLDGPVCSQSVRGLN